MLIKYKGHTSEILTDLCIELGIAVNLNVAENILKQFFTLSFKDLNTEKSIDLLINLPPFLKPFHSRSNTTLRSEFHNDNLLKVSFEKEKQSDEICTYLFSHSKSQSTIDAIIKILKKYIQPTNLSVVYSYMPERFFFTNTIVSRIAV